MQVEQQTIQFLYLYCFVLHCDTYSM